MKSFVLFSVVACLPGLLACSAAPETVGEGAAAVSAPSGVTGTPGQLDQHFTTGVGNPAELLLWPAGNPAVTTCSGAELAITYLDKTGYFSGASSIHAWVRTTQGSGSLATKVSGVKQLSAQSGVGPVPEYFLPLCISTETLTLVEVAFANDAETKWDSNYSRNYVLEFPAAPAAPACFAGAPFSPPPWKAPTPLHQRACTATELAQFVACAGGDCTSGNSTCDACLETDESESAYGPIITGGALGSFVNWGGCQANLDGKKGKGSCGNQTNDWQTCEAAECPATCGVSADACTSSAFVSACVGNTESASCANEWSGTVSECATFASLANLWCGE
jgi:hypothetical protein